MRAIYQPGTFDGQEAEQLEVAPGLFLRLPATITFEPFDIDGAPHRVVMVLSMTAEGVRPTSVLVTAENETPITGTTLRSVRVWDLASQAIRLGLGRKGGKATMLSRARAEKLRAQGPVDETLEWVAYFYNLGGVLGLPPARQVELSLGVPRTTASKWVRRAREAGLIDG